MKKRTCSETAGMTVFASFTIKKSNAVLALPNTKGYMSFPLNINPKKLWLTSMYPLYICGIMNKWNNNTWRANNDDQQPNLQDDDGVDVDEEDVETEMF